MIEEFGKFSDLGLNSSTEFNALIGPVEVEIEALPRGFVVEMNFPLNQDLI